MVVKISFLNAVPHFHSNTLIFLKKNRPKIFEQIYLKNPLKYFPIPFNRLLISKKKVFSSSSKIKPFHNHWITKCLKKNVFFFVNKNMISQVYDVPNAEHFDSWKLCSVLEIFNSIFRVVFPVAMGKIFFFCCCRFSEGNFSLYFTGVLYRYNKCFFLSFSFFFR